MFRRIVVPLDGSKVAEGVLPHVRELAEREGAEVVLVRVVQPKEIARASYVVPLGAARISERDLTKSAHKYLARISEGLQGQGISTQSVVVTGARVAETIVDWACGHNVDLIALMSHGLGRAARWVFGSVAEGLLQASPIPVLVVRASNEVLEAQEEYEEAQLDHAYLQGIAGQAGATAEEPRRSGPRPLTSVAAADGLTHRSGEHGVSSRAPKSPDYVTEWSSAPVTGPAGRGPSSP